MAETACQICGSLEKRILFSARDFNLSGEGPFDIAGCKKCGLVYLNSLLGDEELKHYYAGTYYEDIVKDEHLRHKARLVRKVLKMGSLLDVGCGKGFFLNRMKKLSWDVVGVELSQPRRSSMQKGLLA